ncbi:hypothetical protein [Bacillus cereus]|uniref:hypothetical protein n=1 Tax=Bacillus cereus TaxID=1396 RepID=UPI000BFC6CBB|nr:hypothetical protein [Bacillus cereus]PGV22943.1 hypothetical protein COD93_29190 [Bacillus cereus]
MELVQQIISIQEKKKEKVTLRGADIVATFNGKVIGTIDPISYSVSRERSPIYTLGASLRLSNESSIRTMREARQAGARGLTAQAFWFDEFNDDE